MWRVKVHALYIVISRVRHSLCFAETLVSSCSGLLTLLTKVWSACGCGLAPFPGLQHLQFLIASVFKNRVRWPWESSHVFCSTAYVTDSRPNGWFTPIQLQRSWKTTTSSKVEAGPTCKTYPGWKQNHWRIAMIQVRRLCHSWAFSHLSLGSPLESWLLAWVRFICSV